MERAAQMADWGRKREGRGLGAAYIDYLAHRSAAWWKSRSNGAPERSNSTTSGARSIAASRFSRTTCAETESSIVYGIGLALTERISIKEGAVEQSNFYDYIVPRNRDVPPMHVEVIQPTTIRPESVKWRRR